jgi:dihydrofolate reductase
MISLILACDRELGIGKNGELPWYYPEDLKFFKETTKNSTCVMGYNTCESIIEHRKLTPGKQLLPGRTCIVLSKYLPRQEEIKMYADTFGARGLPDALQQASGDVFIIGGISLYDEAIRCVDSVYITDIPNTHECDVKLSDEFCRILQMKFDVESQSLESGLVFTKYRRTGA